MDDKSGSSNLRSYNRSPDGTAHPFEFNQQINSKSPSLAEISRLQ